jgi:drug/metabolite transporter (DMT)-like permease
MRLSDEAAYASNWKTVLGVDVAVAVIVFAAGAAFIGFGHPLGFLAVLLGAGYGVLVARRSRRWRRLRAARQSGSSTSPTTMSQRSRQSPQR